MAGFYYPTLRMRMSTVKVSYATKKDDLVSLVSLSPTLSHSLQANCKITNPKTKVYDYSFAYVPKKVKNLHALFCKGYLNRPKNF
jgi:hypothetical protein